MSTPSPIAENEASADLFPIRTVSSLTGVNAITLRAWERRYGLIKPIRTPSGHRLYRREEIDLIHRVVELTEKGISIGQVKKALAQLEDPTADESNTWARYLKRMNSAVSRFDEDALEDCYNDALSLHPIEQVTQNLLLPLLKELGARWERDQAGVAEEHFFGVYLRNKLGARFHHRPRTQTAPRILAACLPGELHEVGLLLFALAANDAGMRPILLGANTPLETLSSAATRANCRAIVLSGSVDPNPAVLEEHLKSLVREASVPVFVGGMTSVRGRDAIVSAGAVPLGNEMHVGVYRIRDSLSG